VKKKKTIVYQTKKKKGGKEKKNKSMVPKKHPLGKTGPNRHTKGTNLEGRKSPHRNRISKRTPKEGRKESTSLDQGKGIQKKKEKKGREKKGFPGQGKNQLNNIKEKENGMFPRHVKGGGRPKRRCGKGTGGEEKTKRTEGKRKKRFGEKKNFQETLLSMSKEGSRQKPHPNRTDEHQSNE